MDAIWVSTPFLSLVQPFFVSFQRDPDIFPCTFGRESSLSAPFGHCGSGDFAIPPGLKERKTGAITSPYDRRIPPRIIAVFTLFPQETPKILFGNIPFFDRVFTGIVFNTVVFHCIRNQIAH